MKLALEEADKEGVKYVFATDPDADRFICAERGEKGVETRGRREA